MTPSSVTTTQSTFPRADESASIIDIQGLSPPKATTCPTVAPFSTRSADDHLRLVRPARWRSAPATTSGSGPGRGPAPPRPPPPPRAPRAPGGSGAAVRRHRRSRPSARRGAPRTPPAAPPREPPAPRCRRPGTAARAPRRSAGRTPHGTAPAPARARSARRARARPARPRTRSHPLLSQVIAHRSPPLHVRPRPAAG